MSLEGTPQDFCDLGLQEGKRSKTVLNGLYVPIPKKGDLTQGRRNRSGRSGGRQINIWPTYLCRNAYLETSQIVSFSPTQGHSQLTLSNHL